jgi:hypothetical protein
MNLSLTDEQAAIVGSLRAYLGDNGPAAGSQWSRERWVALADLGCLSVGLSEQYGGAGGSFVDRCLILEEIGKHLVTEPLLLCGILPTCILTCFPMATGTSMLIERVLKGETCVVLGLRERAAKDGFTGLTTTAHRLPNGRYVLNGHKSMAVGGDWADTLLVSASVGNASAPGAAALFLVDAETNGLTSRQYQTMDGGQAADYLLDNVEIGEECLVGELQVGGDIADGIVSAGVLGGCAEAIGAMSAVITMTSGYLKTRKAFGSTLDVFQGLQHRLADMVCALEISRASLYGGLSHRYSPDIEERQKALAALKVVVGRSGRFVAGSGIQLHGAIGIANEFVIGRYFKRLRILDSLFGDCEYYLQRYAGLT